MIPERPILSVLATIELSEPESCRNSSPGVCKVPIRSHLDLRTSNAIGVRDHAMSDNQGQKVPLLGTANSTEVYRFRATRWRIYDG